MKNVFSFFLFQHELFFTSDFIHFFQHFPNSISNILCSKSCLPVAKSSKRKRSCGGRLNPKCSIRNPGMQLKLENNEKAPRTDNIHAQQQLIFPAELREQFTSTSPHKYSLSSSKFSKYVLFPS